MEIKDLQSHLQENNYQAVSNSHVSDSDGKIVLDLKKEKLSNLTFVNVTFHDYLIIRNLDFAGQVYFRQCYFEGDVSFENCKIELGAKNTIVASVLISRCDFRHHGLFLRSNNRFASKMMIESCTNIERLHFYNSEFSSGVNVIESIIKTSIEFDNNKFLGELRFEETNISGYLRNAANEYYSLTFLKCKVDSDLFFKDSKIENQITFQESTFSEEVKIGYFDKAGDNSLLQIINSSFERIFSIAYSGERGDEYVFGGCKEIFIEGNQFQNGLEIMGNPNSPNALELKSISINLTNKFEGFLKVNDLCFDNVFIGGENQKGNIILNNIWITGAFQMHGFINYSTFQLININFENPIGGKRFEIIESYLDKTHFTNCMLDNYKEIFIYNSNLSLIKSSNTSWFNYHQLVSSIINGKAYFDMVVTGRNAKRVSVSKKRYLSSVRETFRQLKYAMEGQGDKFGSLMFKSEESRAAYEVFKRMKVHGFQSKVNMANERLILWFGKVNNYGTSWIKPMGLWLLVNTVFYVLLIWNTTPEGIGEALLNRNKVFVQLLNPIHDIEKVFSAENIHNSTYWIDYLCRFFSGFFIYEIISGFRKHIK